MNPEMPLNIEILKQRVAVQKYNSDEVGTLLPLSVDNPISDNDYERIVKICASPSPVWIELFSKLEIFKDRNYDIDDAKYWVQNMGWEGWKNGTNFIYVVRSAKVEIVGAIDIKSADLNEAEVGYWASEDDRGWMTNTLYAMQELAKNAGFKSLKGLVDKDNAGSVNVLKRCAFEVQGTETQDVLST
jgi:RimJ/RimL family protein N-acetyltransferase